MMVASWRVSVTLFAVFVVLELAFLFLTIGALAPNLACTKAGGWFGLSEKTTCFRLCWGSELGSFRPVLTINTHIFCPPLQSTPSWRGTPARPRSSTAHTGAITCRWAPVIRSGRLRQRTPVHAPSDLGLLQG